MGGVGWIRKLLVGRGLVVREGGRVSVGGREEGFRYRTVSDNAVLRNTRKGGRRKY